MKIRIGFVSNSSSSSFILINPTKNDLDYILKNNADILQLFDKQRQDCIKQEELKNIKDSDKIYITSYVSDHSDFSTGELECKTDEYHEDGCIEPYLNDYLIEKEGIFGTQCIYIKKEGFYNED